MTEKEISKSPENSQRSVQSDQATHQTAQDAAVGDDKNQSLHHKAKLSDNQHNLSDPALLTTKEGEFIEGTARLLFTVVEPFLLAGSIIHVVADITDHPQDFCDGESVLLKRPDGKVTESKCWLIRSTADSSFVSSHPNEARQLSFFLEGILAKEEVPPGTQVWRP